MKGKTILLGLVAIVVIGVAFGVYYVVTSLDGMVRAGIEHYGSEITGTRVRVGSVKIQLAEGRGTIRDVTVLNPDSFARENAFRLGEITMDIDTGSITGSPIVIEELTIAGPHVRYELNASGKSNIDAILANVKRYQGSSSSAPAEEDAGGGETLVSIHRFTFQDGVATADVQAVAGAGNQTEVKLPPLSLSNLGGTQGAPPAAIGAKVTRAYSEKVAAAVAKAQLEGRAGDWLEGQGEGGKAARGILKGLLGD